MRKSVALAVIILWVSVCADARDASAPSGKSGAAAFGKAFVTLLAQGYTAHAYLMRASDLRSRVSFAQFMGGWSQLYTLKCHRVTVREQSASFHGPGVSLTATWTGDYHFKCGDGEAYIETVTVNELKGRFWIVGHTLKDWSGPPPQGAETILEPDSPLVKSLRQKLGGILDQARGPTPEYPDLLIIPLPKSQFPEGLRKHVQDFPRVAANIVVSPSGILERMARFKATERHEIGCVTTDVKEFGAESVCAFEAGFIVRGVDTRLTGFFSIAKGVPTKLRFLPFVYGPLNRYIILPR